MDGKSFFCFTSPPFFYHFLCNFLAFLCTTAMSFQTMFRFIYIYFFRISSNIAVEVRGFQIRDPTEHASGSRSNNSVCVWNFIQDQYSIYPFSNFDCTATLPYIFMQPVNSLSHHWNTTFLSHSTIAWIGEVAKKKKKKNRPGSDLGSHKDVVLKNIFHVMCCLHSCVN